MDFNEEINQIRKLHSTLTNLHLQQIFSSIFRLFLPDINWGLTKRRVKTACSSLVTTDDIPTLSHRDVIDHTLLSQHNTETKQNASVLSIIDKSDKDFIPVIQATQNIFNMRGTLQNSHKFRVAGSHSLSLVFVYNSFYVLIIVNRTIWVNFISCLNRR